MGEKWNACTVCGEARRKRFVGKPRSRREDNILVCRSVAGKNREINKYTTAVTK
jgi:hypothetical protein